MMPHQIPMAERFESWTEHFAEVNSVGDGFWYRFRRSRHWWKYEWPRTELQSCDYCKRMMAKRALRYATLPILNRKDPYEYRSFHVCIGCWQKFQAVWRRFDDLCEIRRGINRLRKAASNGKTIAHNGSITCEAV